MALNNVGLGFIFSARDYASRTIDNVAKSFGRMERATTAAQKTIQAGTAAMTASIVGLVTGLKLLEGAWFVAKASGDFEQALNRLAVASEATTEQVAEFRRVSMAAGMSTQFNPIKSVKTMDQLAQQGFTANQSIQALNGTLNFASAAELEGAEAARTISAALKVFGLQAKDTDMVSDKLMKTTVATAIEANELGLMLGTVSRGAGQTKQSLDEMLVSMGMVKNTGVDASVAASAVSTALLELTDKQKELKKLFDIDIVKDGKFRPLLDIVLELNEALNKIEDPAKRANMARDLSGRFGLTAITAFARQLEDGIEMPTGEIMKGADAVKYLRGQLANAAGTTEKFKKAYLDSLPGQMTLLKGSLETLSISVGDSFARLIRPGVEKALSVVQWFIDKFEGLPEPVKQTFAAFVYVTSGILIFGSILLFAAGALAVLLPMLPAAVAMLKGFFVAALPVIGVLAALGLAFFTLKRAYDQNIGGFADRVNRIFNKVKLAFQGITQFFRHGFIRGGVAKELAKKENEGVLGFVRTVVGYVFRIKRLFSGIFDGFMASVDEMGPIFDFVIQGIEDIAEYLGIYSKETADAVGKSDKWYKVGAAIGKAFALVAKAILIGIGLMLRLGRVYLVVYGFIASVVSKSINLAVETAIALAESWESFKQAMSDAYAWVKAKFQQAWDTVNEWVDSVVAKFDSMVDSVSQKFKATYDAVASFFIGIKDKATQIVDDVVSVWDNLVTGITNAWDKVSDVYNKVTGAIGKIKNIFPDSITASVEVSAGTGAKTIVASNSGTYLPSVQQATTAQQQVKQQGAVYAQQRMRDVPTVNMEPAQNGKPVLSAGEVQIAMQNALAAHASKQPKKPDGMAVYLDGEKVGYAMKNRERGMAANSFDSGSWGEG